MESKNSGTANVMLLLVMLIGVFLVGFLIFGKTATAPFGPRFSAKPAPDHILQMLKDGNERFSAGQSAYLTCDPARIGLADKSASGTVKKAVEELIGPGFIVKDRYQQQATLYRVMKSEKWAVCPGRQAEELFHRQRHHAQGRAGGDREYIQKTAGKGGSH